MDKLLEVASLTKIYHNGREKFSAIADVSLSLFTGDYLSIVGPSGAGKSTLLHIMGGLESPDEGKVIFKGRDIYKMKNNQLSLWRNKSIGFVFQFYHLIEELNVLENVALASFLKRRKSSLKKAQILLEYLGIEARKHFFPSQLSGGERQKVAIARALVNEPQIILCDEPTGNLDKDSQERVCELLEELNGQGVTIVLVTHNLELAKRTKRTLFVRGGELEEEVNSQ
ncbi:MAG: ABC transporter ATP-binding protein [Candidatus Omnitrophica bacterium]|nr:ABC transporter ATP-binding protein [Candidatus Omnitrophota bacterium]MBU0878134.1 ABC transporter ATP-binding protein [Candidatus Omnitrophota bacterium]MBU0896193.1 ABC transporter ATP-binding protein [Candidatus Omnitrophota bacterium]MBU1367697.1 ABC transporter ATP-binding protein [Candidatus Omnitrophota bacterium]MBU1523325.1 ABC transporter ATP-binding protein [Candidatus Omnitrophota bacterium]